MSADKSSRFLPGERGGAGEMYGDYSIATALDHHEGAVREALARLPARLRLFPLSGVRKPASGRFRGACRSCDS